MLAPATSNAVPSALRGAGLGLRRPLLEPLAQLNADAADGIGFLEVAPENWMQMGGALAKRFRQCSERFPIAAHGLSLSIGSPDTLDETFVMALKTFLDAHDIAEYSEHLSFCSAAGQLYDLLPIPFTAEAVRYVAARVQRVQQILERRIALENVSYYAPLATHLSEAAFISAVIAESDCDLLLDVNNVIVNSVNHGYDARAFVESLPLQRVRCVHIAGHHVEPDDLRVDTHGAKVADAAWALLATVYQELGAVPTLLERDFDIPPIDVLMREIGTIRRLQAEV